MSDILDSELDCVELVSKHCHYIHARVGYDNGPQVNDPRAPENLSWVENHEKMWDIIWKEQANQNKKETFICPEFGIDNLT
jgi:hypothetical protein